jgi:hypothetical protein
VAVAAPAFNRLYTCLQQVVCSIQAQVIHITFPKVLLDLLEHRLGGRKTCGGGPHLYSIKFLENISIQQVACLIQAWAIKYLPRLFFSPHLQKSSSTLFEDRLREGRPVAVAAPAFNQLYICSRSSV